MRRYSWFFIVVILMLLPKSFVGARDSDATPPTRWFEPNQGQSDPQFAFLSRGDALMAFFARDEIALSMFKPELTDNVEGQAWQYVTLRMGFVGANPNPNIEGEQRLAGVSNYIQGDTRLTSIPHFGQLTYQELYPNIDLVYRFADGQMQYDFVLAPGADPKQIQLQLSGVERLEITPRGDLLIHAPHNTILHKRAPYTYQGTAANPREIPSRFRLLGDRSIGFEVGAYDRNQPLIIDPTLIYSTYLGSQTASDTIPNVAIDSSGNAYVFGQAQGTGFPTTSGAYDQTFSGTADTFISKLSPDGSTLIYSTFLGGNGTDVSYGIAVDNAGNAFLTGTTQSTDFPLTATAYQTDTSANIYLSRLSADGSNLVYSTRIGAGVTEGIAVDNNGHAYVVGYTTSTTYPTTSSAFQSGLAASSDAFMTRINTNASGSAGLVYSTYLGGSTAPTNIPNEQGMDIAIDGAGDAYITGYTMSSNFPTTTNAYDTTLGGNRDAFVARFDTDATGANSLVYSSYLGGTTGSSGNFFYGADFAHGIAIDGAGNAYIVGNTYAPDYPTTTGAYDTVLGGSNDAFLARFDTNASGSNSLIFSTYLGGSSSEYGWDIQLSSQGVIALGWTSSSDFPLLDPLQTTQTGQEVFITHLDTLGSNLLFSTYFGGSASEHGLSLAVDSSDSIYLTGFTQSSDFPTTTGAYDTTFGVTDGFVARIDTSTTPADPVYSSDPVPGSTFTLEDGPGTTLSTTLSISNTGDAGTLLDVTQVGTLNNFTISTLPTSLTPSDGAFDVTISCTVPQASETLTLQTNEPGNPTYSYTLECPSAIPFGTLNFDTASTTVLETDGTITVDVTLKVDALSPDLTGLIELPIRDLLTGTATVGADYTYDNPTATWDCTAGCGPGSYTKTVSLQILPDSDDETDETIYLDLTYASAFILLNFQPTDNPEHEITIQNVTLNPTYSSDPAPGTTLSFEGYPDSVSSYLRISNTGADGSLLTVTQVGTLNNFTLGLLPTDLASGTTSIVRIDCTPPQESEVLVLQTNEPGNPTYSYMLECPSGSISFDSDNTIVSEADGTITIGVTLIIDALGSNYTGVIRVVAVNAYETATRLTDYTYTEQALIWDCSGGCVPGTYPQTISLDILPDTEIESDEVIGFFLEDNGTVPLNFERGILWHEVTIQDVVEVTPEVTVEVTPEVTVEVTPEVTAEVTPEVTPEVTVEVTPEVTVEVTPEVTVEVTPEVTVEVTPEVTPEATIEVTPEVTPEATAEVTPETTPEIVPDTNEEPATQDDPEEETHTTDAQQDASIEITVFDPAISKLGFLLPGQVGVTGEVLEWIITVSNPSSVIGQNIAVSDTLIDALRVDRVEAPGAIVDISGQTVTVTYLTLSPGETVTFSIFTTVLEGETVNNTGCVTADNQGEQECATGSAIAHLPETGESPFWRQWLWLLLTLPLLLIFFLRRKRAS